MLILLIFFSAAPMMMEESAVWKRFPAATHVLCVSFSHFLVSSLFILFIPSDRRPCLSLSPFSTCLSFSPGLLLTSASKTPSAPSSSDFLSFSDSSLRPGGGTTFSSPPSFSSCLVKPSSEGGASEGTTTLFGSLMSATTASAGDRRFPLLELHRCVFPSFLLTLSFYA